MDLATFLRTARNAAGITQKSAATAFGYSSGQFISNWENGISVPPPYKVNEVAALYKVDAATLLTLVSNRQAAKAQKLVATKYEGITA